MRQVKLIVRIHEGGRLDRDFSNCDLVDAETGEQLPAKDLTVNFPFPDGEPTVNAKMTLYDIEIQRIPKKSEVQSLGRPLEATECVR